MSVRRARPAILAAVLAVAAVVGFGGSAQAAPAAPVAAADHDAVHADVNGVLTYQVHVPPQQAAGRPLPVVVALHGCAMTGSGFDSMKDLTGLNALADREGFLVVYPSQSVLRNLLLCWNALNPADQERGRGEPALLAAMTREVVAGYHADAARVHVLGASSGAAMAVVLGVTYPDVFATVTSMAGGEYGADQVYPFRPGTPTPAETAARARAQMGPRARAVPLLVGQGDADTTVPPVLADRLVAQFAALDGMDAVADTTERISPPGKQSYTHSTYVPAPGAPPLIEEYVVHGMGHAWPGPGTGPFADNAGPDLTQIFWAFARDRTLT